MRRLSDDTLVVFLSDSHIGGDEGRDIFESPDDLAALFDDIAAHRGPVELVLAGDFFDFLRMSDVPETTNRAAATIARPEYEGLFTTLRRLAAGADRRVIYMPGNHDAEVWWNPAIQDELRSEGLVHEFALSYAAAFESDPTRLVYCEHGNEYDPYNTIHDYADPLDTPLGHHIVRDLGPRIPERGRAAALELSDVDRVFPLTTIPEWLTSRLFYRLVSLSLRWLLLPLLAVFAAYETIAYLLGDRDRLVDELIVDLGFEIGLLLAGFALFLVVLRRTATRASHSAAVHFGEPTDRAEPADPTAARIRARLERGGPTPLQGSAQADVGVFVSGHTHAPALTELDGPSGDRIAFVNSGCWLRQLQPVAAHLGMPAVFVPRFVQTHVRVCRRGDETAVELWERPRASSQSPSAVERIAAAGRLPAPPAEQAPRVRAWTSIGERRRSRT